MPDTAPPAPPPIAVPPGMEKAGLGLLSGLIATGQLTPPPALPDIYAVFAGPIDQMSVNRIFGAATAATQVGAGRVHLLFHSHGGNPGDGIALYNFFKSFPLPLTLYNAGQVCSAAIPAFLGARDRKCSQYASFLIHKTSMAPQLATSDRLQGITQSLIIDDARTEAILKAEITLTQQQWDIHKVSDLWLSAQDAKAAGIVHDIGDFAPPTGQKVFNI